MAGTFERLARFGDFAAGRIQPDEGDTSSYTYRGWKGQDSLKAIALAFYNEVQTIRSDTRFTGEGHADKIKEAAKAALKKVDDIYPLTLKIVEERLTKLKAEFSFESPGGEDVGDVLREIEMRGYLLKMEKAQVYDILQIATAEKDIATFRAFINCPVSLNLLNPKIIAQAKEIWAERANPRVADELKELQEVCAILAGSFAEAYEGIGRLGKLVDDSLRARLQRLSQTALDTTARSYDSHRLAEQIADTAGNPMKAQSKVLNTR